MPAPPRDPEPLRAVLVGLGPRGEAWLPALVGAAGPAAGGIELVAVCDPDAERALAALARVGRVLPVAADLDQALDLRPDLVVDCGPAGARLAIAGAALRRGAHVMCEPPLALDGPTASRLAGLSAQAGRRLVVESPGRHRAGIARLAGLAQGGPDGPAPSLAVDLPLGRPAAGAGPSRAALLDAVTPVLDAARAVLGPAAAGPAEARAEAAEGTVAMRFDFATGAALSVAWGPAQAESWRLHRGGANAAWDGGSDPSEAAEGRVACLRTAARAARGPMEFGTGARRADGLASLAMALAALRALDAGGPEPVRPLGLDGDAALVRRMVPAPLAGVLP